LLLLPTNAQFGVPQKRKTGSFEEQNQMAKDKAAGLDSANMLDQLGGMDPNEMMKMYKDAMNDPATKDYMDQMGDGMSDVMEKLSNMDPAQLKAQIEDNLKHLTSPDILDMVLESQDEVLENLLAQGMITAEQMEEYKKNPESFKEEMSSAFAAMGDLLSDPDALNSALSMMGGMADIMGNPDEALKAIGDTLGDVLGDDDKIEEARLQLLSSPEAAGNPALASLFQDGEMQDILQDPIKFREQVKKGQEMMKGGSGGANYGEL